MRYMKWALLIIIFAMVIYPTALLINGMCDYVFPADVAVILGNKVFPDGTPSARLAGRLDRGVMLYRDGFVHKIIVSGATGIEGYNEAVAMRQYLINHDVPHDAIIVDPDGYNTLATGKFTAKYMTDNNMDSVIVVSQYFHNPRTVMTLRRMGIRHVGHARAHYYEWRDIFSIGRELVGFPYYAFRHIGD